MNKKILKNTKYENLYQGLIWLIMALSSFVILEPAPIDILTIIAFIYCIFFFFRGLSNLAIPIALLLIFIISNILSTYIVEDIERGLLTLSTRIYLILSWFLFVEVVRYFGTRGISIIFSGYIFAAILAAILGFLGFWGFMPDVLTFFGRPKALFKDPNVFGPFFIPVALYATLNLESSKGLPRLFWLLIFLISSIGVTFSFSRAAWLNYGITFSSYFSLRTVAVPSKIVATRRLIFYGSLVLLLVIIFTAMMMNQPEVANFFTQRAALQSYDEDRFRIQETALNDALSNFVGIGPGQSEVVYQMATHSLYVRVLVENSWLGTFGLFGFIALTVSRTICLALKANNPSQELFVVFTAALLGILANSFFIDTIHWRHFWLLLALPWGNFLEQSYSRKIKF